MTEFDVGVIGGGVMGLCSAYYLSKSGLKVVLFEQFKIGHHHGSSHGDGRIFRTATIAAESAVISEMGKISRGLWEDIEREANIKLLHKCGILVYGNKDCSDLIETEKILKEKKEKYKSLTSKSVNLRYPQYLLPDNESALFVEDAGIVYADRAIKATYDLCKKYGATIIENIRILKIDRSASKISLQTKDNNYNVSKLVITSGPWTNKVLESAQLSLMPLRITNEQVNYFPVKTNGPNCTDTGDMPVFIKVGQQNYYGLPQINHGFGGIKIGGHIVGPSVDPDNRFYDFDPKTVQATIEDILPQFPYLEKKPVHFVRCLYSVTPDELFILGRHRDDKRVVLGCGFCGAGFKHGTVVGKILTQLVRGEETEVNISSLSPHRFHISKL